MTPDEIRETVKVETKARFNVSAVTKAILGPSTPANESLVAEWATFIKERKAYWENAESWRRPI